MASVLFGGAADSPPPPHIEPLLTLPLRRKRVSEAMERIPWEHTNALRGVFPTFCLDVLCKRGFALGCRRGNSFSRYRSNPPPPGDLTEFALGSFTQES